MGIFKNTANNRNREDKVYREAFLRTSAGLCLLTHPDFKIFNLNDSFAEIFGFETGDLKGSLFAKVWKKCEERDEFFTAIIRTGNASPREITVAGPDNPGTEVVISGVMLSKEMILITVF
ncbi:MAG: PAS domain-containing protein [Methanomicrobiaceae archaeon]|nr:PAS domain-containing protein [Methanomicrobiaceae archaeon]